MRVLHLGGTGNLGKHVIPALLAHNHTVAAFIRSSDKLATLLSPALLAHEHLSIIQGDALDSAAIADALRQYDCDAIVNTAGTYNGPFREQTLGQIVASATSAAITVGEERGKPLRAWIIGGMGSLEWLGTGGSTIQDFMPAFMSAHHRETEDLMRKIEVDKLQWSLLCVAIMSEGSKDGGLLEPLAAPRGHQLLVQKGSVPEWQDHPWLRQARCLGAFLLVPIISNYTTKYEDVADLIAEDLAKDQSEFVGALVGFKDPQ